MRPKEQVQNSAGDGTGSGDPAAGTPMTQPAAGPAPEPSAEPKPAPSQGTGSGQKSGSRVKTGSFCRSMIIGDSDAPWTRYVFQGPYGPRATGLGKGKAEGIWKTPAAYIGRRPGVSGPERAAFIRELQEGKLSLGDPALGAIRASPGRRRLTDSGAPPPCGSQFHLSTTLGRPQSAAPVWFLFPHLSPLFRFPDYCGCVRSRALSRFPPPSSRLLLWQICALSMPPPRLPQSQQRGGGCGCAAGCALSLR